jgi:NADPH:quinone reductase-like Zn-dependent oxidoreductase
MKALVLRSVGSLDDLSVQDVPERPLAAGELRVKVEAAAVNPSDIAVAMGRFPQTTLPRVLGRDFAGRVVDGPADTIGQEVWGSGGGELGILRDGGHAEYVDVPANAVAKRPEHLSAEEAAAIGVPFVTAWSALIDLAGVQRDELVVVSGAAGAVGRAALQIITALGARAVAYDKESAGIGSNEGLNVEAVAYAERKDLADVVHRVSQGRGADVALNAVGAPAFQPLMSSLAHGGRMVIFSAAAGKDAQFDLFAFYRSRLTFYGLDTASFSLEHIAGILNKLNPLLESKQIAGPKIDARFPLSRAVNAYKAVQKGGAGKVVIVPDE